MNTIAALVLASAVLSGTAYDAVVSQTHVDAASSGLVTDNAVARFDGTSGTLIKSSFVILTDPTMEFFPHGVGAGNTMDIRFRELAANGSNSVGFKAPDALAANVTWVLPVADGTVNQVLTTSGTGTLSWQTIATLTGNWGLTGNGISSGMFFGTTNNLPIEVKVNNTDTAFFRTDEFESLQKVVAPQVDTISVFSSTPTFNLSMGTANTSGSASTGQIFILGGTATGTGHGGPLNIKASDTTASGSIPGPIFITSGKSNEVSANITIQTGTPSTPTDTGDIIIRTGEAVGASTSGDIVLRNGEGATTQGSLYSNAAFIVLSNTDKSVIRRADQLAYLELNGGTNSSDQDARIQMFGVDATFGPVMKLFSDQFEFYQRTESDVDVIIHFGGIGVGGAPANNGQRVITIYGTNGVPDAMAGVGTLYVTGDGALRYRGPTTDTIVALP